MHVLIGGIVYKYLDLTVRPYLCYIQLLKVVIMLKAMVFLNLSTKNSNRGRENYLAMIRSRSVNKFLFSVSYEAD